jgi:hypothetical protein
MFCAPGRAFGGTVVAVSSFYVLRSWTHFRRYRGHRFQFSSFKISDPFSAIPRASCSVFMFCTPCPILSSRTRIRRFRMCRGLIFMFCAPGLIFVVSMASGLVFMYHGHGPSLHDFCNRTRFGRNRGCRVKFSILRSYIHF